MYIFMPFHSISNMFSVFSKRTLAIVCSSRCSCVDSDHRWSPILIADDHDVPGRWMASFRACGTLWTAAPVLRRRGSAVGPGSLCSVLLDLSLVATLPCTAHANGMDLIDSYCESCMNLQTFTEKVLLQQRVHCVHCSLFDKESQLRFRRKLAKTGELQLVMEQMITTSQIWVVRNHMSWKGPTLENPK